MNFIPEYQTVRLDSIIKLGVVQVVVDTTIVPKSDAPIDRVLSISCDTIVLPSEVFAGEARFGGTAHYRVLYVDTNGGMQFLSHSVDFSDKVVNSSITQSTKSIFSSHPIDTNTIGTSSHELRLSTTVEVRLDGVLRQDVNCLVAGGDSVYVNNTTVDYSSCVYDVVDSVTVQDSVIDARAVRALGTNANAQIKSCVSGTDVVICQGIVIATVFYLTEGDILKSVLHPIPFTQEISASGVDATNNAIVSVDVKNIKLGDLDENGEMSIDVQLALRLLVFSNATFSPVVDVFSVRNDLITQSLVCNTQSLKRQNFVEERIDGSVSLDDSALADAILSVNDNNVYISTQRCENGIVTLEGIFGANIVYYNADLNTKNTIRADIPFSINVNNDVTSDDSVMARAIASNITTKIRRGNEIELRIDLGIFITITQSDKVVAISQLELGEERVLPNAAFSIHIAKANESIWEIAKVLGATPETILQQNPNLVMPLIGGERVVAYRQLSTLNSHK